VGDAVTWPFLPELNVPVAMTGPATVVLFWALGLAPPRLTQTYVAVASAVRVALAPTPGERDTDDPTAKGRKKGPRLGKAPALFLSSGAPAYRVYGSLAVIVM
jgi:hypothetical protein